MGLFGRKEVEEEVLVKASEKIIFEQLNDNDERARELVYMLRDGHPLVLNFEKLSIQAANKLLGFFAGACVAVDGNVVAINEKTYLFARQVDFLDGSLNAFIENI